MACLSSQPIFEDSSGDPGVLLPKARKKEISNVVSFPHPASPLPCSAQANKHSMRASFTGATPGQSGLIFKVYNRPIFKVYNRYTYTGMPSRKVFLSSLSSTP
jgi:hypothetical protein